MWGFPFCSHTFFLFPPGFISLFRLFCFVFVCFCYLPKQQCILYLYFVETATAKKTDHQVFILNYFLFHRVLLILRCFLSMILVCLCVCAGSSVRKTRKRTIHTFFFLLLFIWLFVSFSLPTIQVSSTFNFLDSV